MTNHTGSFSLNWHANHRRAILAYLANLPVLDGRVLRCHYSENKDSTTIALEMGLSKKHVERILTRAQGFSISLKASDGISAYFPVCTRSPIGVSLRSSESS
jgi:hypothetical protein